MIIKYEIFEKEFSIINTKNIVTVGPIIRVFAKYEEDNYAAYFFINGTTRIDNCLMDEKSFNSFRRKIIDAMIREARK